MIRVRALGALGALAGIPLLAVSVLLGIVGLLVAAAAGGVTAWVVVLLLAGAFVAAGSRMVHGLGLRPAPAVGPELTRAEHPGLWAEIDAVSGAVGTDAPGRVVLVPDVVLAVARPRGAAREMTIGLPLFATFTVGELRAAMAHALGQHPRGMAALDALVSRIHRRIAGLAGRADGVSARLLEAYLRAVAPIAGPCSRETERAADLVALRVAGSEATEASLRMLSALDLAWRILSSDYLPLFARAGARASLAHGLRQIVITNASGMAIAADTAIAEEPSTWRSTQPPVRERLGLLAAEGPVPAAPGAGAAAPDLLATLLLSGGDDWLAGVEGQVLSRDLPFASWQQVIDRSVTRDVIDDGIDAMEVLADRDEGDTPTIAQALDAMVDEMRHRRHIGALFLDSRDDHELHLASLKILQTVVVVALHSTGRHRVSESWDGPWCVVDGDGQRIETESRVVAALRSPEGMRDLRSWLVEQGVDLDAVPRPIVAELAA